MRTKFQYYFLSTFNIYIFCHLFVAYDHCSLFTTGYLAYVRGPSHPKVVENGGFLSYVVDNQVQFDAQVHLTSGKKNMALGSTEQPQMSPRCNLQEGQRGVLRGPNQNDFSSIM